MLMEQLFRKTTNAHCLSQQLLSCSHVFGYSSPRSILACLVNIGEIQLLTKAL